jgi:hypothetical protein
VPILIGGRGDSAIHDAAAPLDRTPDTFGVNVWCGLDADAATADRLVGDQMQACTNCRGRSSAASPQRERPEQVAEWISAFVDEGRRQQPGWPPGLRTEP